MTIGRRKREMIAGGTRTRKRKKGRKKRDDVRKTRKKSGVGV